MLCFDVKGIVLMSVFCILSILETTGDYFIILQIDINNHSTEPDRTNHICRYIDIYICNMYILIIKQ